MLFRSDGTSKPLRHLDGSRPLAGPVVHTPGESAKKSRSRVTRGRQRQASLDTGLSDRLRGTEVKGLAAMQLMQALQLVVHGDQLITDVNRVVDAGKIVEHRLDLCLAGDQDAALGRSWFVGHEEGGLGEPLPSAPQIGRAHV